MIQRKCARLTLYSAQKLVLTPSITSTQTHDGQAPWPDAPPSGPLPLASLVTVIQLAHVCALIGVVNGFVLTAARQHLAHIPATQEKIVGALLTPLAVGDVIHIGVTIWALGDARWDVSKWSPLLWTTLVLGVSLLVPRLMWHAGIWRYTAARDGQLEKDL